MRRTNSFTLETDDGKIDVKVYEVRPLDLLELHKEIQRDKLPLGEYERLLPFCTNLSVEQLTKLYPSELRQVIDAFREVNSDFFAPWPTIKRVSEKVGLADMIADLVKRSGLLDEMRKAISKDWQNLFASLQSEGMFDLSSTGGGTSASASDSENDPSKRN